MKSLHLMFGRFQNCSFRSILMPLIRWWNVGLTMFASNWNKDHPPFVHVWKVPSFSNDFPMVVVSLSGDFLFFFFWVVESFEKSMMNSRHTAYAIHAFSYNFFFLQNCNRYRVNRMLVDFNSNKLAGKINVPDNVTDFYISRPFVFVLKSFVTNKTKKEWERKK